MIARIFAIYGLAMLLAGCSREPSEVDMLHALRRYHDDWVATQRRQAMATHPSVLLDLSFEASLALQIQSVRKERCRAAVNALGFVCTIDIVATTPYVRTVTRRIEARFVEGAYGWLMRDPNVPDVAETSAR